MKGSELTVAGTTWVHFTTIGSPGLTRVLAGNLTKTTSAQAELMLDKTTARAVVIPCFFVSMVWSYLYQCVHEIER